MKKLWLCLGIVALFIFIPGLCSAGDTPAEAPRADSQLCGDAAVPFLAALDPTAAGSSPPLEAQAGTCCVREFVKCAVRCRCGVASFNCTLDFPGCTPDCTCNPCP